MTTDIIDTTSNKREEKEYDYQQGIFS